MAVLDWMFYGNTVLRWSIAAGAATLTFAVLWLGKAIVVGRLAAVAARTATGVDDLAVHALRRTKLVFLLVVAVFAGSRSLVLPDGVDELLRSVAVIALLVQAALWGSAGITFAIRRYLERETDRHPTSATTVRFVGFVARFALWLLILLVALDNLGFRITTLVAGLGVGGIAVALAVQKILSDLFASLSIVLDKPFEIGDFIVVDDLLGTVEVIGLKTTRIRSLSGEQIVFSNADLLSTRVRNFKRMYQRRVVFGFGVTYETPYGKLARIPQIVRGIVEAQQHTRFDRAHFHEYGDFSLNFEVVYFVLVPEYNTYMDIQQAINLEIFRRFAEEGIEFAYPTRTLHVRAAGAGVLAG